MVPWGWINKIIKYFVGIIKYFLTFDDTIHGEETIGKVKAVLAMPKPA